MDNPAAARLVLIGSAASQAMSPGLWNPVLRQLGRSWTYEAWDVPRDAEMPRVRGRLLEPGIVAANVTMPHKHWAAETVDVATDEVRASGACNLLVRQDDMLRGHNTDITAVRALVGGGYQRHALIMGAGGAGRAAVVALAGQAGTVTITDMDPGASAELRRLAQELGMEARAVPWPEAQRLAGEASVIVNATPVGKSATDGPVWGRGPIAPDALIYDFVYAGHVTGTVARCRELGLRCVDGWDHLREQAVAMVPFLGLEQEARTLLRKSLAFLQSGPR